MKQNKIRAMAIRRDIISVFFPKILIIYMENSRINGQAGRTNIKRYKVWKNIEDQ